MGQQKVKPIEVHYDKAADILLLVLSSKKIDDGYDTGYGIVEVAEDGEPVMLTILQASTLLKELGKVMPKNIQKEVWAKQLTASVAHKIRK